MAVTMGMTGQMSQFRLRAINAAAVIATRYAFELSVSFFT